MKEISRVVDFKKKTAAKQLVFGEVYVPNDRDTDGNWMTADTIEKMALEGNTVLVSTHIIDSVDMLWDRTLIMQNGVIRAAVKRTELAESGKHLEDLYFAVTEGAAPEGSV